MRGCACGWRFAAGITGGRPRPAVRSACQRPRASGNRIFYRADPVAAPPHVAAGLAEQALERLALPAGLQVFDVDLRRCRIVDLVEDPAIGDGQPRLAVARFGARGILGQDAFEHELVPFIGIGAASRRPFIQQGGRRRRVVDVQRAAEQMAVGLVVRSDVAIQRGQAGPGIAMEHRVHVHIEHGAAVLAPHADQHAGLHGGVAHPGSGGVDSLGVDGKLEPFSGADQPVLFRFVNAVAGKEGHRHAHGGQVGGRWRVEFSLAGKLRDRALMFRRPWGQFASEPLQHGLVVTIRNS